VGRELKAGKKKFGRPRQASKQKAGHGRKGRELNMGPRSVKAQPAGKEGRGTRKKDERNKEFQLMPFNPQQKKDTPASREFSANGGGKKE